MNCHVTVSIKTGPKRPKQFTRKFLTRIQFLVCNINNNRRAADDFMFQTRKATCHCNLKTYIPAYQPTIIIFPVRLMISLIIYTWTALKGRMETQFEHVHNNVIFSRQVGILTIIL